MLHGIVVLSLIEVIKYTDFLSNFHIFFGSKSKVVILWITLLLDGLFHGLFKLLKVQCANSAQ